MCELILKGGIFQTSKINQIIAPVLSDMMAN